MVYPSAPCSTLATYTFSWSAFTSQLSVASSLLKVFACASSFSIRSFRSRMSLRICESSYSSEQDGARSERIPPPTNRMKNFFNVDFVIMIGFDCQPNIGTFPRHWQIYGKNPFVPLQAPIFSTDPTINPQNGPIVPAPGGFGRTPGREGNAAKGVSDCRRTPLFGSPRGRAHGYFITGLMSLIRSCVVTVPR